MAAIFDRMVKDRRFTRSGVPDLTIWNPDTKKFKVIISLCIIDGKSNLHLVEITSTCYF